MFKKRKKDEENIIPLDKEKINELERTMEEIIKDIKIIKR